MKAYKTQKLIPLMLLVLTAVFSFLLYRDMTYTPAPSGMEQIGNVSYKYKKAERKYAAIAIWDGLDQMAPVYDHDSIRTVKRASAKIHFLNGTVVNLDEDTLVVINIDENGSSISFEKGSISASGISDVNIKTKDAVLSLNGTVAIQEKNGQVAVSMSSGSAQLKKDGKTLDLVQNQQVSVGDREMILQDVQVIHKSPVPGSIIVSGETTPVVFSWINRSRGDAVLEISKSTDFSSFVYRKPVHGNEASLPLQEGEYYWRLKKNLTETNYWKVSVIHQPAPVPALPAKNEKIIYRDRMPAVKFMWTGNPKASSYTIEISGTKDFKNTVFRSTTVQREYAFTGTLPDGTYFWRVKADYPFASVSEAGPSSSFSVIKQKELPTPVLRFPNKGTELSSLTADSRGISMGWTGNPEITSYTLQLSKDRHFRNIESEEYTHANSFSLKKELTEGTWYWRVKGKNSTTETPFSETSFFNMKKVIPVTLSCPQEGEEIHDIETGGKTVFQWQDPNRGSKYRLLIARDPEMVSVIKRQDTDTTRLSIKNLPGGKLYCSISLISLTGEISSVSPVRKFFLVKGLEAPQQIYPGTRATVDLLSRNELVFRWTSVPGATAYDFTLYRKQGSGLNRIFETTVKNSFFRFTDFARLDRDIFCWEIKAKTGDGASLIGESPAARTWFRITLGEGSPDDIKITSPDVFYTE